MQQFKAEAYKTLLVTQVTLSPPQKIKLYIKFSPFSWLFFSKQESK